MKKNRNFKFIRLILLFALALILSGGNVLIAQGKSIDKKPKPPPVEEKWAVNIPEGFNLYDGTDGYVESDEGITVSVDKYNYNQKGRKGYRYDFSILITKKTSDIYLGIQNVSTLVEIRGEEAEGTPCGFPDNGETAPPFCLERFLNGQHPHSDYLMVLLRFSIHDREILDMYEGEEIDIWALNLSIWDDIPNDEFKYHSIQTTCWPVKNFGGSIYLKKSENDDNVWTLFVVDAYFEAYEFYREYINPAKSHSYYPLYTESTASVNMKIDWKKIIVE